MQRHLARKAGLFPNQSINHTDLDAERLRATAATTSSMRRMVCLCSNGSRME